MESMSLILDTSILIGIEKENTTILEKLSKLKSTHQGPIYISFITLFEFYYGLEKMSSENKLKYIEFIMNFTTINTTDETAILLSSLKYKYTKKGKQKSMSDLIIASQAIEHNLTLITLDKDFEDISELKKEII